jgi:hypothetical protein
MTSPEGVVLRGIAAERRVVEWLLAPWGGPARCLDAYESGFRAASELLRAVARVVDVEPVRTAAATAADLTRDIGAAQISGARWLLDA